MYKFYLKRSCTNPPCNYWHPPVCQNYKSEAGYKVGDKWSNQRQTEADRRPSEKSKKSCGKRSAALFKESKQLGCTFRDTEPPKKSILRKSPKKMGSNCTVIFSKGTIHRVKIRERKGPSQGVIQKRGPQEHNPCAPEFEDRTPEETLQR